MYVIIITKLFIEMLVAINIVCGFYVLQVELNRFLLATNIYLVDAVDIVTEAAADCGSGA